MADETVNNPRDWGHKKSPFFKLPPEIRNKIYREYFADSEVSLVIDPPANVQVVPVTGRRSIFSTANSNHHFLLTCMQVYLEALALYWSTTLVRNGCDGHFSRSYFLNRIPAIAKPFIQHLRDVSGAPGRGRRWLRGEVIRWSPSLAQSLGDFPSLKTCFIKDWRRGPSQDLSVEGQCDEAVARNPNVHFFDKDLRLERVPLDPMNPQGGFLVDPAGYPVYVWKYVILDRTTGRKVTWVQNYRLQWLSDDACIEMLMDPTPSEFAQRYIR